MVACAAPSLAKCQVPSALSERRTRTLRDSNLIYEPGLELRVLRTFEDGHLLERKPLARRPRKVDVFEVEIAELDDLVLDGGWDISLEEH